VDLSVPRAVDAGAKLLPGVELLDLDSLAEAGLAPDQALAAGIEDAERIVKKEIQWFGDWTAGRQAGAIIAALRSRVEAVCSVELERSLRGRSSLSRAEAREVLRRSLAKLLHAPTIAARQAMLTGDDELISNEYRIFGLQESAEAAFPATRATS
jgi:glutamyl-tRNA reductase